MSALATDLRKRLEKAIQQARLAAEEGATQALEALGVAAPRAHKGIREDDAALRRRLRAHGRQLGDERQSDGAQEVVRLRHEIAYEHWHRMLFARFLAENELLIEPESGVALSLDECRELARDRGKEPYALAASFARDMLPQIFRSDDPVLDVTLPPETRQRLQGLLAALPRDVFVADDALGWTYQFWQSAEKDAVNRRVKSGKKISGHTLPAVTQLFTEPYMVQFLLHNTIGAWHAGRVLAKRSELAASAASEQELREAVALDGYTFDYLRFVREAKEGDANGAPSGPWRPAAGLYDSWPAHTKEITVLDPCCGSGHFLVAAFELLVRLRRREEAIGLKAAIHSVLAENLFGLELDPRCTQIAAFHLAFAAWRLAGHPLDLPPLHLACSGIGPQATNDEWLALAEAAAAKGGMPVERDLLGAEDSLLSSSLKRGLAALHEQFSLAPELGSLIDPKAGGGDLLTAGYDRLRPLLDEALVSEIRDDDLQERAVAAQGMAKAASLLSNTYTLVLTNVPYLGIRRQGAALKAHLERYFYDARHDLANAMQARLSRLAEETVGIVITNSWLFSGSYQDHRTRLLEDTTWHALGALGHGAFETIGGAVVNVVLHISTMQAPPQDHALWGVDASAATSPRKKAQILRKDMGLLLKQRDQLKNPDARVILAETRPSPLLADVAQSLAGIQNGDSPAYLRKYWEVPSWADRWAHIQTSVRDTCLYGGYDSVIDYDMRAGHLRAPADWRRAALHDSDQRGQPVWGRQGVLVSRMSELPCTVYAGYPYDQGSAAIVPDDPDDAAAIWMFCSSPEFRDSVRVIDTKLNVTSATLAKVPYDRKAWSERAAREFPNGLPAPISDDPTQWLFHGDPAHAEPQTALQVASARLIGYRWPPEYDAGIRLAPEARSLVAGCSRLTDHTDADGIVCLPSLQGEAPAEDRVRALLADAFGDAWSAATEADLLRAAGEHFHGGRVQRSLTAWLRDRFFAEHCALFHKRPFIWHVWDGHPDGFSALVNYHCLAGPDGEGLRTLEALTYTYLGAWITRQRGLVDAGEDGAEGRLAAALVLDTELRKIIEGEPPYDVFVRWKPLHEQPLGWAPDINDGVRLNIRPFLKARDVKGKNAGILRAKPDTTWCKPKKPGVRDRGKEPESLRPRDDYPWFWGCDPEAHAEHLTDFGAGTPGATPAGEEFDGIRWNGLHYTRAAKEASRRKARGSGEGGSSS